MMDISAAAKQDIDQGAKEGYAAVIQDPTERNTER